MPQATIRVTHEDYGSSGRYAARLPGVEGEAELTWRAGDPGIIVADHTKMNCISSFLTCPLNRIDMIVTDWMAPPAFCKELEEQGVCVVCVEDTE